jgi:hypothetical protein
VVELRILRTIIAAGKQRRVDRHVPVVNAAGPRSMQSMALGKTARRRIDPHRPAGSVNRA